MAGRELPLAGLASVAMLFLAACGSQPTTPEPSAPVSVPAARAPAPTVQTAPASTPEVTSTETPKAQTKAPVKSKTAVADAQTEAGASLEAPIPPQAQQQFDNALGTMNAGNPGAAEQAFKSLAAAYPTYAGPLLNVAILQANAGRLEEAQKTLDEAIARNGNNAAAFNQLGIVYRRLGRFKEADEAYQQALRVDTNYALAWLNLGVLCDLYLQQPQRALEAYERYLALAASPDARVNAWITELKTRLGSQERSARSEQ